MEQAMMMRSIASGDGWSISRDGETDSPQTRWRIDFVPENASGNIARGGTWTIPIIGMSRAKADVAYKRLAAYISDHKAKQMHQALNSDAGDWHHDPSASFGETYEFATR